MTKKNFIPLIRFYDITSTDDYFNKVKPYEKILSEELRDDILKFYMVPGYRPAYIPRGVMINQSDAALFANWIDRKNEGIKCIKDNPYQFNLLYKASRDGNTAAEFHAKCDNKGATIVIVKIKNSDQIVGGYNPLFWDSCSGCMYTNDSFIFSFTDQNDLQSSKVVYSNGYQYPSVQSFLASGPVFSSDLLYDPTVDSWRSKVYS